MQYTLYSTLHADNRWKLSNTIDDNFDSPPKVNKTNRAETTRFVAKSKQRSVTKAECVILYPCHAHNAVSNCPPAEDWGLSIEENYSVEAACMVNRVSWNAQKVDSSRNRGNSKFRTICLEPTGFFELRNSRYIARAWAVELQIWKGFLRNLCLQISWLCEIIGFVNFSILISVVGSTSSNFDITENAVNWRIILIQDNILGPITFPCKRFSPSPTGETAQVTN